MVAVSPDPPASYQVPAPRTVSLSAGASVKADFALRAAGSGGGPHLVNWWVQDTTLGTPGHYLNPDHGDEVAGDCNTFLIVPAGADVMAVLEMTVTSACGHTAYQAGTQDFSAYTWQDGVITLPAGAHGYRHWWLSTALHNGPATITVRYLDGQYTEQEVSLGIVVHNVVIEPVYDGTHTPELRWDPHDPAGQAGRSKTGVRFAVRSAAKTSLPLTRRIWPLHHDAREGALRVDLKAEVTTGEWDTPRIVDWDWDGRDGSGSLLPQGVYPYEVHTWEGEQPFLSGGGDCIKSVYLLVFGSEAPPAPDPRPADRAQFIGYNSTTDAYDFAVDYGLQHCAPGCTHADGGCIRVLDPHLAIIAEYAIADLDCLAHSSSSSAPVQDGLHAQPPGQHHRLLVELPRGLMTLSGTYAFVVTGEDGAGAFDNEHRSKKSVDVGQDWKTRAYTYWCIGQDNESDHANWSRVAAGHLASGLTPYESVNQEARRSEMIEGLHCGHVWAYFGHGCAASSGAGARPPHPSAIADAGLMRSELIEEEGCLSQLRLAAFFACHNGEPGSMAEVVYGKGAQCAFGWNGLQYSNDMASCNAYFWQAATQPGASVEECLHDAALYAYSLWSAHEGILNYSIHGDVVLVESAP